MPLDDLIQAAPRTLRDIGKPLTAQGVRQTLARARKRFVNLLLQTVAGSLELPTPNAIHEELRELDLAGFVGTPDRE